MPPVRYHVLIEGTIAHRSILGITPTARAQSVDSDADRETLLVSSLETHSPATEAALWSEGSATGLVVIARRLLAAALDADDGLGESVDE